MRVAVPEWNGHLSPVFDAAACLLLIDMEQGREMGRRQAVLSQGDVYRRAAELRGLGVDLLLCGAISRTAECAVRAQGIRVIPYLCGGVGEILEAFIRGGRWPRRLLMPGRAHPPGSRHGHPRVRRGRSRGTQPAPRAELSTSTSHEP